MEYLIIKKSLLMIHIYFLIYKTFIQIDLSVRNEVFHDQIHNHIHDHIRDHARVHVHSGQILPHSDARHVHDGSGNLYEYGDFHESRWSLKVLPPTEQQSCETNNAIREILSKKHHLS